MMTTTKPSVLDGHDHTECANKIRQPGYWHVAAVIDGGVAVAKKEWVKDQSTVECKYDRRRIDPACAAAKCARIGGDDAAME